jgi:S-adenosylmethionine synthetase
VIRVSEFVLPGHPDKFCDAVADAIIAEVLKVDADGYGQVEASVWSDHVFLTGAVCTRQRIQVDFRDVVVATGIDVGYTHGNHIDARRYNVTDTVCRSIGDPTHWTSHVNDQAICIGWAGYDEKVDWLPIEHWLARSFRDALCASCKSGRLEGQGPDGKLLVRVREEGDRWTLEHALVTLQQRPDTPFLDLCAAIAATLEDAYAVIQRRDARWCAQWSDVALLLNPNGPFIHGGSDGDNGQTGRKLVMDFYGPRVPIGGGALSGKDPSHVDRLGARMAREAALEEVRRGAQECLVRLTFAPGNAVPDVDKSFTPACRDAPMLDGSVSCIGE